MLYQLEQGATEAFIIKQCVQQKLPLPEKIANAPELLLGLEFYYLAFSDLTSCRNSPDSQISWIAIKQWAEDNEVQEEQKEDLFFYIQSLDAAFLDYKASVLKRQRGMGNGK